MHDLSERITEEQEMYRDDLRFSEIMDNSTMLQDGRYCLKMTFNNKDVSLLAIVRQRM